MNRRALESRHKMGKMGEMWLSNNPAGARAVVST